MKQLLALSISLLLTAIITGCGGGAASTPAASISSPSSPSVPAGTYYVSATGSDSNAGTASAPWLTLTHADSVIGPGTEVIVQPGVYNVGSQFSTVASGTATQRIIYLSATQGGAQIRSTGSAQTDAVWWTGGNYVDYVGFDLSGPGYEGFYNTGSYDSFLGNYVHDIAAAACGSTGGAGILDGNFSATSNKIIGNRIWNISPSTGRAYCHGIYTTNFGAVIQNNVVWNASGACISAWHGATSTIITNNTLFNCTGWGMVLGDGDDGAATFQNAYVANNIVYNNGSFGIQECCSGSWLGGPNNVYTNNLLFGNPTESSMQTGVLLNTVRANPDFVSYTPTTSTGNYQLSAGSPAIGTGTSTNAPAYDFNGGARSGSYDLGAYQSASTPAAWPWYSY
jgi:hypothetical protein